MSLSGGRKSLLTEDLKSKPAKIVELHEEAMYDTQLSHSVPALPQTSYAMSDCEFSQLIVPFVMVYNVQALQTFSSCWTR